MLYFYLFLSYFMYSVLNTSSIDPFTPNTKFYHKFEKRNTIRKAILNLENLLNHLSNALKFFERNFKTVNLDGLFGVRISEVITVLTSLIA